MYDTVLGKLPVSVRSRAGPGPDRPSAAAARRGAAGVRSGPAAWHVSCDLAAWQCAVRAYNGQEAQQDDMPCRRRRARSPTR
jgi:hypothetical protein